MVQSLSPPSKQSDQNTAMFAGVTISIFTFGEFLMATQWARIRNQIGRKPTFLIESVRVMILAILFGFSNSLLMTIAARTYAVYSIRSKSPPSLNNHGNCGLRVSSHLSPSRFLSDLKSSRFKHARKRSHPKKKPTKSSSRRYGKSCLSWRESHLLY